MNWVRCSIYHDRGKPERIWCIWGDELGRVHHEVIYAAYPNGEGCTVVDVRSDSTIREMMSPLPDDGTRLLPEVDGLIEELQTEGWEYVTRQEHPLTTVHQLRRDITMPERRGFVEVERLVAWQANNLWAVRHIMTVSEHDGPVKAVAFHPSGRMMATGGSDHLIHVWELPTGRLLHTHDGHHAPIHAIAFVDDSLVAIDVGGTVRWWYPDGFNEVLTAGAYGGIGVGGTVVLAGHMLFDRTSLEKIREWEPAKHSALSPDGHWAALAQGSMIAVHDTRSGLLVVALEGLGGVAMGVRFSPDGRSVFAVDIQGKHARWNLFNPEAVATSTHVSACAISRTGILVLGSAGDHSLYLHDLHNVVGSRVRLAGKQGRINALAFNADDTLLASAGTDGTTRVWGVQQGYLT